MIKTYINETLIIFLQLFQVNLIINDKSNHN